MVVELASARGGRRANEGKTMGRTQGWRARVTGVVAATMLGSMTLSGVALADDIGNRLDGTLDATAEQMALNVGGPVGSTVLYVSSTNGDGKNGCNLTGSTVLTVSVLSSDPAVATVSPSSLIFGSCGDQWPVTVTPVAEGTTTVSLRQTSNTTGGTFDLAPATFLVNVAGPANTAPTVSVEGVTPGVEYAKGTVLEPICQVVDAEDGDSSFPATLSDITGPDAGGGIGEQTATCSYTDQGGLTATSSVTYTIADTSGPSISYVLDPETPASGWHRSGAQLTWTVTDDDSPSALQTEGCEQQSVTADGTHTFVCTATSAGGTASETVTVKHDGTAPVVSEDVAVVGNLGAHGWYTSDVEVTFSATDATSSPETQSATVSSTGEGGAVEVESPAFTDAAGNTAASGEVTKSFKIDKTAPEAPSASLSPAPNGEGWHNGDVVVSFEDQGDTGGSGVASCTTPVTVDTETAGETVTGVCTDAAGNVSDETTVTVKLDKTGPVITSEVVDGTQGNEEWYVSDVTVEFRAADEPSGLASGLDSDGPVNPTRVTSEGEGTAVSVASPTYTDRAGNSSGPEKRTFKIDKTAPEVADGVADRNPNAYGWYQDDVTVTFSATDETSGPAEATKSVTVTDEGETTVDSPAFSDQAGNETAAGAKKATVKIDRTDPLVSLSGGPADGGSYTWGSVPAAPTCDASDALSGLAGACSVSGYSTAVGDHTVTATAIDRAGNSAIQQLTYTVEPWHLTGFYQPVDPGKINTVKAGSTVPLKFEVFAGDTEMTSTTAVKSFTATPYTCTAGLPEDTVDITTTGGTTLRYDTTAGQFVQNWQTPKSGSGTCYKVTTTTSDGTKLTALFKLK